MTEVTDVAGDAMIVAGMIQILKPAGLPTRFAGLAAIACGVAWCLLAAGAVTATAIALGIVTGLSASGVYEAGKQLNALNPLRSSASAESATSRNSTATEVL